jgi:sugar (pentulose or hexulose) kinase
MKHGDASINTGSAAFVTVAVDHPIFDPEMRVLCNVSSIPGQWVVEGGTLSAGLAYQWCAEEFCGKNNSLFKDANTCCAASPPGANGVIMAPSLGGRGAPYWNPAAKGFFHNIGFAATRDDFVRATLEGIAAELADCLETVREAIALPAFSSVSCAGGLSRSSLFNDILADSANTVLRCAADRESSSRGAWMVAAVALGLFEDHAAAFASATRDKNFFLHTPDPARHALYSRINKARRYIYEAVDMRIVQSLLK